MNKPNRGRDQGGFSLIELLIVIVILGILSSISVVYLNASRRAANGASAVQSLRVISESEASYTAGVGNQNYGCPENLYAQDMIDIALAGASTGIAPCAGAAVPPFVPKSGFQYNFTFTPAVGNSASTYNVVAVPFVTTTIARTGDHTFYVDQTGVIRISSSATTLADSTSNPLN